LEPDQPRCSRGADKLVLGDSVTVELDVEFVLAYNSVEETSTVH
jgi:hypothetical protein